MWSQHWSELIAAIHQQSRPTVLVTTGGGASAIAELLAVPGASRTVLDAHIPYSSEALIEWLGRRPDQFCDERTALAMASVAAHRAKKLLGAAEAGLAQGGIREAGLQIQQLVAHPIGCHRKGSPGLDNASP